MPIVGLTDRGGALPRLGILRKGGPKVSERQPGRDLGDHFRLDTPYPDVLDAFTQLYGDKPNGIRVMLLHATPEENFQAWKEHHSAGALKRRCDGETCVQRLCDDGRYDFTPTTCVCATELQGVDKKHLCRPVGRLEVVLPELQRLGSVLVATTSIHDIIELQQNLTMIAALRGDLRGIPLILSRRPRKVSMPGDDGKRRRVEKWLLALEPAPDWVRLQLSVMEQAARPSLGAPAPALPAPAADPATGQVLDGDWSDPDDEPAPADAVDDPETMKRLTSDLKALRAHARELGATCPTVPNGRDATAADLQACLLATRQAMLAALTAIIGEAEGLGIPFELPAAPDDLMPAQLVFFGKQLAEQIATAAPAEQLL